MNIYVIGPVTGIERENIDEFCRVAEELRRARNSVDIPHDRIHQSMTWNGAMARSIHVLTEHVVEPVLVKSGWCNHVVKPLYDGVAMLDGWEQSKGACIEKEVAEACGIECKPWREWL